MSTYVSELNRFPYPHPPFCIRNKPLKFSVIFSMSISLQWRHNERDDVSNHQPHECLLNRLFRRRSKKTPCVTGLCERNSPVTDEFPAQRASNVENVSIWWRHHIKLFPHSDHVVPLGVSSRKNTFLFKICEIDDKLGIHCIISIE